MTYRLYAPFGHDNRQYDGPRRRMRTRSADVPRNHDRGDRACLSKSPLERRLSRVRGNVEKSARDRQRRLSREIKPTAAELPLKKSVGKQLILHQLYAKIFVFSLIENRVKVLYCSCSISTKPGKGIILKMLGKNETFPYWKEFPIYKVINQCHEESIEVSVG